MLYQASSTSLISDITAYVIYALQISIIWL